MIGRWRVLALGLLVGAAACSVPTDESAQVIEPETLPEALRPAASSTTTTTTPPPEAELETVFLLGPRPDSDQRSTVGVERALEPGATPEDILRTLFGRGGEVPVVTEEEDALGYINTLDDFTLHSVDVDDDAVAVVDISLVDTVTGEASEETIGRDLLVDVAAQIVWTATEIDGIDRVLISRDGVGLSLPTRDASGDGGDAGADEPVGREDYERYDVGFEFPPTTTTAPTTASTSAPTATAGG